MSKFIYSGFADEISKDLKEQIKCLKELSMEYLELRGVDGVNVADFSDEMIENIKRELSENGIKVSSIGSPIGKYDINEDLEIQIEKVKRIIEIAHKFDTKYIRIFSYFMKPDEWDTYRDEVIRRLSEFVKLAEAENVIMLHENEKDIFGENAENCKYIFDNIKSPNLKGVFDPANFVQCGVDTKKAFETLREDIVYMHIKDSQADGTVVPAGAGLGNIPYILSELNKSDYEGFVSLEPHLGAFEGLAGLEKGEIKIKDSSEAGKFKLAHAKLKEIINSLQEEK